VGAKMLAVICMMSIFTLLSASDLKDIKKPKNEKEYIEYRKIFLKYEISLYSDFCGKLQNLYYKYQKNTTAYAEKALELYRKSQNSLTNGIIKKAYALINSFTLPYNWNDPKDITDLEHDLMKVYGNYQFLLYWVIPQWYWDKSDPDEIDDSFYYTFSIASENYHYSYKDNPFPWAKLNIKISDNNLSIDFEPSSFYDSYTFNDSSEYEVNVFIRFGTNEAWEETWINNRYEIVSQKPFSFFPGILINNKLAVRYYYSEDQYETYLFNISSFSNMFYAHTNDYLSILDSIDIE